MVNNKSLCCVLEGDLGCAIIGVVIFFSLFRDPGGDPWGSRNGDR